MENASPHCPLSRIHPVKSFLPLWNCSLSRSGFGGGWLPWPVPVSQLCAEESQHKKRETLCGSRWGSRHPIHGFQIAKSNCFVSVLPQQSRMCFTKTNITEPKNWYSVPTRLVLGYTVTWYIGLFKKIFLRRGPTFVSCWLWGITRVWPMPESIFLNRTLLLPLNFFFQKICHYILIFLFYISE